MNGCARKNTVSFELRVDLVLLCGNLIFVLFFSVVFIKHETLLGDDAPSSEKC